MKVCVFLAALAATSLAVSPPYYETCDDCMGAYLVGVRKIAQLIEAQVMKKSEYGLCEETLLVSVQAQFEQLVVDLASCDEKFTMLIESYAATLTGFHEKICKDVPEPPKKEKGYCFAYGNVYVPVNDCDGFYQVASPMKKMPPYEDIVESHTCDYGLKFDVKTCNCVWAKDAYCPPNTKKVPSKPDDAVALEYRALEDLVETIMERDQYDAVYKPPTTDYQPPTTTYKPPTTTIYVPPTTTYKPPYTKGYCEEKGNIYTPVNDCRDFDQSLISEKPITDLEATHSCPDGTLFDVTVCVCNHPQFVKCPPTKYVPRPPPTTKPPVYTTEKPVYTTAYKNPDYRSLLDLMTALEAMSQE